MSITKKDLQEALNKQDSKFDKKLDILKDWVKQQFKEQRKEISDTLIKSFKQQDELLASRLSAFDAKFSLVLVDHEHRIKKLERART